MKFSIKTNILLVDDEPDLRAIVKGMIEVQFTEVRFFEASNGKEALAKARLQQFDLVITDLRMPVLDGISLIENFNKLSPKLRPKHTIVISAAFDNPLPSNSKVTFLSKPVDSMTLLTEVAKYIVKS